MYFKQFYDTDLAQGSYLIGCQATGEAVVVDPRRDVAVYLADAAANGLRVTVVTETHIHADYLSGARELAAATGAALRLSAEGGPDWLYAFEHEPLRHGDVIDVGNVRLTALHTPGHTPEHLSFLVTDRARSDEPTMVLTGDFVFVGDLGRPDLLDEAAGYQDTRYEGARQLFRSLKERFLTLPDHVQVWPGHGAGSACGKALGAVASSTVGYERLTAWWADHLANDDVEGFVAALLEGQPDAPSYFGRMKRQNRAGPALLGARAPLKEFTADELRGRVNRDLVLVDTRTTREQWSASVPGALAVPGGRSFATYAAWVIDPEVERRPIVLLASDAARAAALRDRLTYVGIDGVVGYLPSLEGLDTQPLPLVTPAELEALPGAHVLDVRTASEHAAGHVPGSQQLHAGRVLQRLAELPRGGTLVLHCQSGGRSLVVASALRNRGFGNVVELEGSYEAWRAHQRREVVEG
ncbi:MAG: MBL fold metallo-hydrolase [Deinococcales bacterium]|nr:MBL fold metallo-hydrolase [Deinococcales bacterium]